MKRIVCLLAIVFACHSDLGTLFARNEGSKLWVFLEGRPYLSSGKLPSAQWGGYTPAAAQRREMRASIPWNESDYPVDPRYLRALRSAGAEILHESRWLNAVSVRCDGACRSRLRAFSFVKEVRGVATFRRPKDLIEPVSVSQAEPSAPAGPPLNYGQSRDQLAQLKVPVAHQRGFAGQGEIVAIFDTGFRKDHVVFKDHVIVAERDFVFGDDNVSNDVNSDSHGTGTWSCVGGAAAGMLYGPAYQASFILAATEDVRSEMIVEEDNWVAAFEWADRMGASVVSSSLGYTDWYRPFDLDGTTPITSRVASMAAQKGVLVVNSAGNSGPGVSTLGAPADARNILTVGAVNGAGDIANFSSRGPTADGRMKPEVVARGLGTFIASSNDPTSFGRSNGTSFSCPLTAGFSAVLLSAHPDWTPLQVREAVMMTASRKESPDNTFGYGIPNMPMALNYLPQASVVIDHKPLKNTSKTTAPYKVTARIRAQRVLNINQLFLFWKKEGSGGFTKLELKANAGKMDVFEASIPAQQSGTTLLYYLSAKDVKGKVSKAPYRAPKNLYSFNIQ